MQSARLLGYVDLLLPVIESEFSLQNKSDGQLYTQFEMEFV